MEKTAKKELLVRIIKLAGALAVCLLLVMVDQWIKAWAQADLQPRRFMEVIPKFLEFRYCRNVGAAFSLLENQGWFFILVGTVFALAAIYILFRVTKKEEEDDAFSSGLFIFCTVLLLAGCIGNMYDRIVLGYVVDYIRVLFIEFPIFNFADCLICVSCFLLIIFVIFRKRTSDDFFRKLSFSRKKREEEEK